MELWQGSMLPWLSLGLSGAALAMSLVTAFPVLKTGLAVARDAVLWLALFFIAGGVGFVVWKRLKETTGPAVPPATTTTAAAPAIWPTAPARP